MGSQVGIRRTKEGRMREEAVVDAGSRRESRGESVQILMTCLSNSLHRVLLVCRRNLVSAQTLTSFTSLCSLVYHQSADADPIQGPRHQFMEVVMHVFLDSPLKSEQKNNLLVFLIVTRVFK